MNEYVKRLYKRLHENAFIRCFYGKCPKCGKRIWSIGDVFEDDKIKAKFVCECGHKYKETVYSRDMGKYKYGQALPKDIQTKKWGTQKCLELKGKQFLILPDSIKVKELKK